jgi:predicted secreted protein
MRWFSIIAIYFLFWFLALFGVLPFSARTTEEAGETPLPGHVESAPHQFRPWLVVWRTTVVATILMVAFYAIYRTGYIDINIPGDAVNRIPD